MKKILLLSTLVAILIVLGGLSPSICSKDIKPSQKSQNTGTITVEVNKYHGLQPITIHTELSNEEAEQLKEILIQLDIAIENNDETTVKECESILNEKGIFGDYYEEFYTHKTFNKKLKSSGLSRYLNQNGDNFSNLMCYFHAVGTGQIYFFVQISILENMANAFKNVTSIIAALMVLFIFLPFYVLALILTHLVPFRIMMPLGFVELDDGKMTSIGLKGLKRAIAQNNESIMANVSWFSGLTINIPTENLFLFMSGIAVKVAESDV